MNKLSTLKDCKLSTKRNDKITGLMYHYNIEAIRQSAINDIKELDNVSLRVILFGNLKVIKNEIIEQIQNYIKWKFNISEEDLK